jgi:hypothetical protein
MAFAINGCGTRYHGRSDKESGGSYVATEWITFAYVPLIPIRSFRMRPAKGGVYVVVYASQKFQAQRVPLHLRQIRNMYLTILSVPVAAAALVLLLNATTR